MKAILGWDLGTWQQVLGVIVFLGSVGAVAFLFTALLIRIAVDLLLKKQSLSLSRKDRCILLLAGLGSLCVLYGYFIEPYWLEIKTVQLRSDKIHGSRAVRIVQISDLHCDSKPRLEEKLPDAIRALKPDIITFTGDAINKPAGLPIFRHCMSELAKIAPTCVVKGNWDAWYFKELDRFSNTGAVELDGKPVKIKVAENDIWLNGLPVGTSKTVSDVMLGVPENAYRIFLFHYPDCIEEMSHNKIDLYLAGHTHGGQVALPFYGALITLSASGKRYESGLYHLGETYLYVNRGIGMEGGTAPRVRFCARPEVTVIDISGNPR